MYFEIQELAKALDSLTARGTATIFGVCGRALAPLLKQVEQRSGGRFTIPDLALALNLIEAFATGSAEAADHSELRGATESLSYLTISHPWSTYVQDVLVCVNAGLAAASVGDRPRSGSIEFALEPLTAMMENRDVDVIRTFGDDYWSREIIKDPAMAAALGFLREVDREGITGRIGRLARIWRAGERGGCSSSS